MQRIEAIQDAAILDPAPLAAIPDMNDQAIDADPTGAYRPGEDVNNYNPHALIDAAIAEMVAIQNAAAHAVIDGPASAQCSC